LKRYQLAKRFEGSYYRVVLIIEEENATKDLVHCEKSSELKYADVVRGKERRNAMNLIIQSII
jgi:3'-phosphoadenosine 5'-phosphosulfate sulfotransferase